MRTIGPRVIWTHLANPSLEKSLPTLQFVKDGKLKKSRLVYVCGFGATGSLGIEQFYKPESKDIEKMKQKDVMSCRFRRLGSFRLSDKINDVACGYGFTVVAAEVQGTSHTALGFGLNDHSQIGYHASRPGCPLEVVAKPSPIVLPTKSAIKKVSCGRSHSLFLNATGQVLSLGNNSMGQCGRRINKDEVYWASKKVHILEDLPANIIQIEAGQDNSMFVTEDGQLYSCGWGSDGQLGLGHFKNQEIPAQVKGDLEKSKIVKVSTCADTALALDDQGNVFGWGNTEYAQFRVLANCDSEQFNTPRHLKLTNIPGKIVDVAAGGTMCAILNDKGQVYVWGFGLLGKGPNVDQSSRPTLIPESLFGMNIFNQETKVVSITAGLAHFGAISSQGDLYTWGRNRGMCLGFMHKHDQFFPMRVNMNLANVKKIALGVDHSCALVEKVC